MPLTPRNAVPAAARVISGVFGVAFFGVGLTVIIFMLSGANGAPTFFRIVGTLIALPFLGMGGALAASAVFGGGMLAGAEKLADSQPTNARNTDTPTTDAQDAQTSKSTYTCPACGGGLGPKADVSPLGDVKCPFCGQWFNIHRPT